MSTIKSSAENLTLNADGANNDIKFQSNGSEVASIDQAGLLTATSFAGNADDLHIKSPTGENMIKCVKDAQVNLYYNNAAKLSTSSTGVTVTGGVAIGGTGAANTLDDYEEGTWTAGITGASKSGGGSTGYYTKIGRKVFFQWYSGNLTISSASGAANITGLPFTSTNNIVYGIFNYQHGNAVDGGATGGMVNKNNTTMTFLDTGNINNATYINGSTKYIMVAGNYFVD